ncbi:unnamed protein product [Protopolystoma xenopodis]|uniref:Uncharacterized protein n=1 Tax=Protopolystoma xenopodis TaxID=117903 RepID=A0A3S5FD71_9PLAT|nr:unnamed protein product [Protopolystoma xenopodis]
MFREERARNHDFERDDDEQACKLSCTLENNATETGCRPPIHRRSGNPAPSNSLTGSSSTFAGLSSQEGRCSAESVASETDSQCVGREPNDLPCLADEPKMFEEAGLKWRLIEDRRQRRVAQPGGAHRFLGLKERRPSKLSSLDSYLFSLHLVNWFV